MKKINIHGISLVVLVFTMLLFCNLTISAENAVSTKDLNIFTWRNIGPFTFSGRITDFAVPRGQSQIYYVATASGGIWKTEDGGIHFEPIFDKYGNMSIGYIDVALSNPDIIYVGTGEAMHARSSAHGNGMWKSTNGGKIVGAEVYRSDDRGENWTKVSPSNEMMEGFGGTYGWVFGQIRVDPNDENTIYIMGLALAKSTDGGKSFKRLYFTGLHGDHHGLWIDPEDSNYLINVNDGGVNVSYDGGEKWRDFHTIHPVVQFYNVAYDMEKPFNVYGSVQDHGTYRGNVAHNLPWRQRPRGLMTRWESAPGGEGTTIAVDTTNPNIMYSSSFYGRLQRSEYKPGLTGKWITRSIVPKAGQDEPPLRGQWLAPTIISPHNHKVIYHGMQYLFRSKDMGETWERISPDLSYNDPDRIGKLPFAIPHQCLTDISESPFQFGLIYVGTDDGRVHITKNSGKTWTEIVKGLPYNKHVSRVVASKYEKGTVYLTLNGRRDDDFTDYIYKSTDYGQTWIDISGNIPGGPVNVIREDPKNKDVLYVGTDLGVYVTVNSGKEWQVLANGLPNCFVWDIIIHPRDNTLVIATNGRGMYVIDDVSPIQKYTQ